jgi:hypothetical protein
VEAEADGARQLQFGRTGRAGRAVNARELLVLDRLAFKAESREGRRLAPCGCKESEPRSARPRTSDMVTNGRLYPASSSALFTAVVSGWADVWRACLGRAGACLGRAGAGGVTLSKNWDAL